jgi:hypothetical protein
MLPSRTIPTLLHASAFAENEMTGNRISGEASDKDKNRHERLRDFFAGAAMPCAL